MNQAKLYLIPNFIEEQSLHVLPSYIAAAISECHQFVVEHPKIARKLLIGLGLKDKINQAEWMVFDKKEKDVMVWMNLLQPILEGKSVGIISDAGCPGIADPGADLVNIAHDMGIEVVPLVGPSSIFLGLMASGMNGQSFTFWGYLPIETKERVAKLKTLEKFSKQYHQTQIFIETPYRNEQILKEILRTCHKDTQLCIAANLTSKKEYIKTRSIGSWQKNGLPNINKIPAVFYLLA